MTAPEPLEPRELLKLGDIARMFRVDPKTVVRWDQLGQLRPAFRTPGGQRRYYRAEVEALLPRGEGWSAS